MFLPLFYHSCCILWTINDALCAHCYELWAGPNVLLLQVHRNRFVQLAETCRVRLILRWRRKAFTKAAAEGVSPYLAYLAETADHEKLLLSPVGREVSIVRSMPSFYVIPFTTVRFCSCQSRMRLFWELLGSAPGQ